MPRVELSVRGVVQGVGFRPFVYREAVARGLVGWVRNAEHGVRIEVQGAPGDVEGFVEALVERAPAAGRVDAIERRVIGERDEATFAIVASETAASPLSTLAPDLAICADCLTEIRSPGERRHAYPFTSCASCGPRWSIVEALPYDRQRTSMKGFAMCEACAREYEGPADRRFHAEPVACPRCGPRVRLLARGGVEIAAKDEAIEQAASAVLAGQIVALRGLGGFQLVTDATSAGAVIELRRRKLRDAKPFAVMFPDLAAVRASCFVTDEEARALASPEAPIVLLAARSPSGLAEQVSPGIPLTGAMLPYTPLHCLLLQRLDRPVVCTSGNLSGEPMCVDVDEALDRLGAVADIFLVHDRPIARPVDDSVVRAGRTGMEILRRARGHAPRPVAAIDDARCILGLGAHLKSTVSLAHGGQVITSQHLGDLGTPLGASLLEQTAREMARFAGETPSIIACDLHPDLASTRLAERLAREWDARLVPVQHHHAHVAAVMAEHGLTGQVLGLAWDGLGLGPDWTLWGGEALCASAGASRRVGHLRVFPLPGGDAAAREPRRAALGAVFEALGAQAATELAERWWDLKRSRVLLGMLERGISCPRTSSIGRLFDAIAAIAGVRTVCSYEGQAAMELEHLAAHAPSVEPYPLPLGEGSPCIADFAPLLGAALDDARRGRGAGVIAARLHAALVELGVAFAQRAGLPRVVLAGGCFQNARLSRALGGRLETEGFRVYTASKIPPNDGGISVGQVLVGSALAGRRSVGQIPIASQRTEPSDVSGRPG